MGVLQGNFDNKAITKGGKLGVEDPTHSPKKYLGGNPFKWAGSHQGATRAVSYTHLTLPTIYSV